MNLPDGITEEEFVSIVNKIANRLCDKFKFGYYDREDIKQECYVLAIDGIQRYDNDRPLINFLWTHIHNRLCNLKRNKYFRLEKPCDKCPVDAYLPETDGCTAFQDKMECKLYQIWAKKNETKQNIMNPIGMSCVNDENEQNMYRKDNVNSQIASKEIIKIIDDNISIPMRKYWLQQKAGIKISKKYRTMLLEEIHTILEVNDIDVEKAW